MATRHPTLRDEICEYNQRLDERLKLRTGGRVSVRVYKVIKGLTQLVGAGAGILAMQQGADPMTAFFLIALIISGPEVLEVMLTNVEEE